ncbi:hypothetical protein AvCA_30940 [Azotobacter vinelandii CA]|uniref:DUF3617 family protein n=2 Tax=Azotobacter vinelandii TaxID=354 RepID=C1DN91_AZOVD|nr:hypothetical protein [Azotobacter vinelandii]ACO79258.1 hypothetical protein Avin_30940 [Azotobacter vinelandii DJ]AGK16457.1 hypothetical protein AvCA_30940 [Azotobacter vinelandii CA]AGK21068.1 hypothetical protein AvCA6_30940 [Azotobacter vinelandii CA6]WKN20222.1 hypothetical protein AVAEIV_003166 [Azotobacter vinelandii]SFY17480.1 hypothetical protein SAMN04244547_04308 [Azotobacter vinelandii]
MLYIRHIALLACLASPLAMAAEEEHAGHPPGGHGHMEPPAAAFTACEGKKAGDTASFSGPGGRSMTGTCRDLNGKLAAMPEHGGRKGPPPSAAGSAKACEGKKAGDTGSFSAPDGKTRSGVCRDMNGKLMLVPEPMGERIEKD